MVKTMLNEVEMQQVARAIAALEQKTDAELITVVASRADHYLYISLFLAAVVALISPLLFSLLPLWLGAFELLLLQWLVFIVFSLVFRSSLALRWLIPKQLKMHRAHNLARCQFLEHNLHHAEGAKGILIFVSELEQYIEIIADHGVSEHVNNDRWREIIQRFSKSVKSGKIGDGFIGCIEQCGQHLEQHCPLTAPKKMLSTHLVVL